MTPCTSSNHFYFSGKFSITSLSRMSFFFFHWNFMWRNICELLLALSLKQRHQCWESLSNIWCCGVCYLSQICKDLKILIYLIQRSLLSLCPLNHKSETPKGDESTVKSTSVLICTVSHFPWVVLTWLWWLFCSGQKKRATSCALMDKHTRALQNKTATSLWISLNSQTSKQCQNIKHTLRLSLFLSVSRICCLQRSEDGTYSCNYKP